MRELFPLVAGLLAGVVLARLPRLHRRRVVVPVALVLGLTATVLTGEFRLSWAFLAFDVPLVAVSSAIGVALAPHLPAGSGRRRAV